MEKYEQISVVGEGSYGLVLKCKHRETDQLVAVKKFLETEEDATVRRMALREIRMLKKLKHENLVTMIEVFRYRKRFYLVFEYLEGTILDELEKMPGGLGDDRCRERIFQVTRAVNFCHSNNIIHRDVKPENVLVSSLGVVKLCDFGFARIVTIGNEPCTEYVATRWYRAPELLVGEEHYGSPVDIWAIGCLFAEMMTGDPLFPGESDIDQLYLILKMIGKPCSSHQQLMLKNSQLRGMIKATSESNCLYKCFSNWSLLSLDFLVACMKMDPHYRLTSDELLRHNYYTHDKFPQRFLPALRDKVHQEFNSNPLLRRYKADILLSTDRRDEYKQRRSLQTEPCRWKFNLTEGSIKRKFSCDTVNDNVNNNNNSNNNSGGNCDRNLISLTKSSQKLNVIHRVGNNNNNKQSSTYQFRDSKTKNSIKTQQQQQQQQQQSAELLNKQIEMQKLEKSLQNLTRLTQIRPSSVQKNKSSPLTNRLSSPQQFQSLQHGLCGDFINQKSPKLNQLLHHQQLHQHHQQLNHLQQQQQPHGVLHPSINNITFKEPLKKSPNSQLHNLSLKSTFGQVPLINAPKQTQQFLKKLDRNVLINETTPYNEANWLNGGNAKRKDKLKGDDFTLPNLPGATSPMKSRKKNNSSENGNVINNEITPRIQSSTSQKSTSSKILQSLPFM